MYESDKMAEREDLVDIDEDGDDEGITEIEFIANFLQTEEGETITQVMDKIAKHMENQNKILIKLLSALSKKEST